MAAEALVVVDMQNGFCRPGGLIYVPQAEEQIPACAEAIRRARAEGIVVAFTQVRWDVADDVVAGLRHNLPPLNEGWSSEGGFHPGAWGHRIVDELAPASGEHRIMKRAFHPTGLADLVAREGVETAYVVGTTANNCVYAACLALFEANISVRAVGDCISSFDESFRTPWLANVDRYLGDVVSLDELGAPAPASR